MGPIHRIHGRVVPADERPEYAIGRAAYQKLGTDEVAARFDPALDPTATPAS